MSNGKVFRKSKCLAFKLWQATFNRKAKLEVQMDLANCVTRQRIEVKQSTIDQWLGVKNDNSFQQLKRNLHARESEKDVGIYILPKEGRHVNFNVKEARRGGLLGADRAGTY